MVYTNTDLVCATLFRMWWSVLLLDNHMSPPIVFLSVFIDSSCVCVCVCVGGGGGGGVIWDIKFNTPRNIETALMSICSVIGRSRVRLKRRLGAVSHSLLLIIEIPTVIGKFRTAIKAPLFYFNLYLSVMLDGLSCSYPFLLLLHEFVLALETLKDWSQFWFGSWRNNLN